LPDTCLLRISAGTRLGDVQKFVMQLNARLGSLTTVFRSKSAANEKEVQDAVDALIKSRETDIRREHPTVRFATKNYKPDFAATLFDLLIEVKFPRATRKLSGIIDEMGSDVNAHRKAGKHIVFIVYDPEKTVSNDDEFRHDFEEFTPIQVFVTIIR
jgi:DpnII restriction endonuclease